MQFVTVRDFRTRPAQIWKELPESREIVITNNGKPIALLTPISDASLEDTLTSVRKARAIQAVNRMQEISAAQGNAGITAENLAAEIDAVRQAAGRGRPDAGQDVRKSAGQAAGGERPVAGQEVRKSAGQAAGRGRPDAGQEVRKSAGQAAGRGRPDAGQDVRKSAGPRKG